MSTEAMQEAFELLSDAKIVDSEARNEAAEVLAVALNKDRRALTVSPPAGGEVPAWARLGAAKTCLDRAAKAIAGATVASCECGTKTPDPAHHSETCRYRALESVLDSLQGVSFSLERAIDALPLSAVLGEGDGTGSLRSQADLQPKEEPTGDSALLSLADRCEREEPSRDLDTAIANTRDFPNGVPDYPSWRWDNYASPNFTTSLDAAVTLVPDEFLWAAGYAMRGFGGGYTARVTDLCDRAGEGKAVTAIQALCAAALRVRAKSRTPVSQGPLRAERATPPTPDRDGEREG